MCCVPIAVLLMCLRRVGPIKKNKNVHKTIELETHRTSGLDAEMVSEFGEDGLMTDVQSSSDRTILIYDRPPSTPSLPIPLEKVRGVGGGFNPSSPPIPSSSVRELSSTVKTISYSPKPFTVQSSFESSESSDSDDCTMARNFSSRYAV